MPTPKDHPGTERTGGSQGSRAEKALMAVLPRNVQAYVDLEHERGRIRINGTLLDVVWAMDGNLGTARRLVANRQRPLVAVARLFSPGARQLLGEAGVGWVDESGAAEISIGPIVVSRTGTTEPKHDRTPRWTRSALAVAEAVLCGTKPTTHAVVADTGLSVGSSINGLRLLTDLGLLKASKSRGPDSGRAIGDFDALLAAYSEAASSLVSPMKLELGVLWRELDDGVRQIAEAWSGTGLSYAITGAMAAELLAPHLTSVPRIEVYVGGDTALGLEVAADIAGFKRVPGGRLVLRPFPTVSVLTMARQEGDVCIAPWPRVYVDLLHAGLRGEDAAEHLKETMHG